MTYEDLTPEEQAEADRNPIEVATQEEFYDALDLSYKTGRPVVGPTPEQAREWGYGDWVDGEDPADREDG